MTVDTARRTVESRRPWRGVQEALFQAVTLVVLSLALAALAALLWDVWRDGAHRLSWQFLTSYPSRLPARAGILPALVGSVYLIVLTAAIGIPIGIGAAIYLEEYGRRNQWSQIIEINIANLAAVPHHLWMLGLGCSSGHWVRAEPAGGAPSSRCSSSPSSFCPRARRCARCPIAQGRLVRARRTKWHTIGIILPMALPGILTGLILSLSRAIGETAPLVVIGAPVYLPFIPDSIWSQFTALPLQIFNWVSRPQAGFAVNAAAGIIVLLVVLLAMNATAIWLRDRYQRRRAS